MNKFLHQLSMWLILTGGLALLYIAYIWFQRDNLIMSIGMLIMGVVAFSNFYLHRSMMSSNKKHNEN